MIWKSVSSGDENRLAVERYVRGRLSPVVAGEQRFSDCVSDAVMVISTLWDRDLRRAPVPEFLFDLLAAKVLVQQGDRPVAVSLLTRALGSKIQVSPLVELMAEGGPTIKTCWWLSMGVLRPVALTLSSGYPAWSIDLNRLVALSNLSLPLSFHCHLMRLVRVIGEMWESSSGEGSLYLAGRAPPGLNHAWKDIPYWVARGLAREACRRGWQKTPVVCRPLGLP